MQEQRTSKIRIKDVISLNTEWDDQHLRTAGEQDTLVYVGSPLPAELKIDRKPEPMLNISEIFDNMSNPDIGRLIYMAQQAIAFIRFKKIKSLWPIVYTLDPDSTASRLVVKVHYFSRWNRQFTNPAVTFFIIPNVDYRYMWENFVRSLEEITQKDFHKASETEQMVFPHEYDKQCVVRDIRPTHARREDAIGRLTRQAAIELQKWHSRQRMVQLWDSVASIRSPAHAMDQNYYLIIERKTWFGDQVQKTVPITPLMTWGHISSIQQEIVAHEMRLQQHVLFAHREAAASANTVYEHFTQHLPVKDRYWLNRAHQWDNQTWTFTLDRSRTTYLI